MFNRATLIGNLGQDPQIKSTPTGKELATFSLATSESWKDKISGEKKYSTEWHKIVVFNPSLVNLLKAGFIKKGSKIMAEGAIKTRKYHNQNESKERYVTEIVLDFHGAIQIIDNKSQDPVRSFYEPENKELEAETKESDTMNWGDENIPF